MIGEKIILMLSRKPDELDYDLSKTQHTLEGALNHLYFVFGSDFEKNIVGKKVLDFGCGSGYQVLALAKNGANLAVGIEIRKELFREASKQSKVLGIEEKVNFVTDAGDDFNGFFDVIISQNSFEHYADPVRVLELWKRLLKTTGKIYITFGPPWFAPYGSHSHFFTKVPWVHLLFSESTVMRARNHFRSDGAKRYEEIEGGLNRMTIRKFENIVSESGFTVEYVNYGTVKKIMFLRKIPFIRELFINQVDCVLAKKK